MRSRAAGGQAAPGVRAVPRPQAQTVALVLFASLVAGLAVRGLTAMRAARSTRADSGLPQWARLSERRDPVLGHAYALPEVYDMRGRRVPLLVPGACNVVLFLWRCDSCGATKTARALGAWLDGRPGVRYRIVIVRGTIDKAKAAWPLYRVSTPPLLDPRADVARKLNAFLLARVYVFGPRGRLRYVSRYQDRLGDAERRLERLLPRS